MVALAKEEVEETRYTSLSTFQYLVSWNIFRKQWESLQAYIPIERIDSLFSCVFIRASTSSGSRSSHRERFIGSEYHYTVIWRAYGVFILFWTFFWDLSSRDIFRL